MATRTGQLRTEPLGTENTSRYGDPVAVVREVTRCFGATVILDAVNLTIHRGEFVALLGRSGSGKSTLLRALAGLDHGVEGAGDLFVTRDVSVVFQDSRLLPWARVLDNVTLGLTGGGSAQRGSAVLADVGLPGRERAWPYELSGGEQQRVALARSLVRDPALLLADEPFGALDALTRIRMHGLLQDLCAKYRPGVLLVTHDVDEAVALADRVLVLDGGRFVADRQLDFTEGGERTYRNPQFVAHREALLDALGVRG
ncbi:ABC transporter ATP-binding protein [Mycolicibacterium diernhoferi]|uniref:ABC transporter ATP-binding protein n=1 Tax=Mycolicibacterium diernhoferi TaxID=1801 RepID=A0A2A7NQ70_9MYCO|nr:ABC transporter ATP-binding protein [Mycolicibacterium diernhoferi]PEG52486.1 ABC transporter ATP-binding protein [Mycolicibacterium diernhoferi]QYL23175.1 ABC transporter ATP-binding protein [Mycolicibacterium diernhoferi]